MCRVFLLTTLSIPQYCYRKTSLRTHTVIIMQEPFHFESLHVASLLPCLTKARNFQGIVWFSLFILERRKLRVFYALTVTKVRNVMQPTTLIILLSMLLNGLKRCWTTGMNVTKCEVDGLMPNAKRMPNIFRLMLASWGGEPWSSQI